MAFNIGQIFGKELCEVLGLDSSNVSSLALEARAGGATQVTIVRYLVNKETARIKEVVERYRLVPREDAEG